MELITFDSGAFKAIMAKIEGLNTKIEELAKKKLLDEVWLDNQDVCQLLKISKRTLQNHRDTGKLPYSQIDKKIYYKPQDVKNLVEQNYRENK